MWSRHYVQFLEWLSLPSQENCLRMNHPGYDLQDVATVLTTSLPQVEDGTALRSLQSHQLSPSQPVLQASSYMSGMEEKDRHHLEALVDTAIIKVSNKLLTFSAKPAMKCIASS